MQATAIGDFDFIRQLVRDRSAIVLDAGKEYLAESRLLPVARAEGFGSVGELVGRLRAERFGRLHQRVVEAMTTNETSFFRDTHPFDALRAKVIPELVKARGITRTLRVWCAAASTGQEPYSMVMLLRDGFPELDTWSVQILATDLSSEVVARGREGRYSHLEVNRGLPARFLVKYFDKKGIDWQLRPELRSAVEYRELNLIDVWPALPTMDVVFLRNVLIYFDVDTKKAILTKVRRLLAPDGYLILGSAETTLNLDDRFEREQIGRAVLYRPRQP